jgi:hypothetical protein
MAREYVLPGVGVVNETGARQYVTPGGTLNETSGGTPSVTLAAAWTEGSEVIAVTGTVAGGGGPTPITAAAAWTEGSDTIAATGTVSAPGTGSFVTPELKNNTGTLLANETGVVVNIYNVTTGALVVRKTGLTSNASGIVTVNDALIVAATTYAYEVVLTANGRILPVAVAS